MATIQTTIANTSGFLPSVWAQKALDVLRQRIVLAKLVARDSDFQPGWVGQTLNIPYPGTFVANAKAADTPATVQQPVGGASVAVTLDHHKYVDFIVEDIANTLATPGLIDRYTKPSAIALADQLETDLMGTYAGFTSPAVGTPGTDLTASVILDAQKALNIAKVDINDRYLVISPKDQVAILKDANLTNYFAFSRPQDVQAGQINNAPLYGFDVYMSQHLQNDISTNAVQTVTVTGTPTGGTFTLTFRGVTSAAIVYNATAAQVLAALVGTSTIGAGNVTVTGAGPYTVTFVGALDGVAEPLLVLGTNSLTGGASPSVTIATATAGATRCLAFQKEAILLAMRPFRDPPAGSGVAVSTVSDPDSGLSIRCIQQYDPANRGVRVGFDLLYGFVNLRPTLGVVVNT